MIYAKRRKLEGPERTKERKKSQTQPRKCVRLIGLILCFYEQAHNATQEVT